MKIEIDITLVMKYVLYSMPMISAVICWLIIVLFQQKGSKMDKDIQKVMGRFYFLVIVFWLNIFFYDLDEEWLKYLIPLTGLIIQLAQVSFYHFTCIITSRKVTISIHYAFSVLSMVVLHIAMFNYSNLPKFWSLPIEMFYQYFMNCFIFITVCFYSFLSVRQLYAYKRELEVLPLEEKKGKELNWVFDLLKMRFLFAFCYVMDYEDNSFLLFLCIVLLLTKDIKIVYNILQHNYMSFEEDNALKKVMLVSGNVVSFVGDNVVVDSSGDLSSYSVVNDYQKLITQEDFESYFATEKPYLDKEFRLESLVGHFGVNRTYLSKFINTTFGCNFSQYVNKWRLKEVDYLKSQPENQLKKLEEIVDNAGFRSIRNYWRVKKIAREERGNFK